MKREALLSAKELAQRWARSQDYVYQAKRKGLPHVSGRFEYDEATDWLRRHPKPCSRRDRS